MASPSQYHDIPKPDEGKDPYTQDYYDLVDSVDSDLKRSGLIGERPTSDEAPEDAWYEATDQKVLYRNDPELGWVVVGGLGSSNRPLSEIYTEGINGRVHFVIDGTKDDLDEVVQNASDGDEVYVIGGTYTYSDNDDIGLNLNNEHLHVKGVGRPVVRLADGCTDGSAPRPVNLRKDGAKISNFEVDGNVQNFEEFPQHTERNGRVSGVGITNGMVGGGIYDCYIHDIHTSGIVSSGVDTTIKDVVVENVATDHWIYLADAKETYVENVKCRGYCRISGITYSASNNESRNNHVQNVIIEDVTSNPFDVDPRLAFSFRQEEENSNYNRGNTIENVRIRNATGDKPMRISIRQPDVTVRDVVIRTRDDPRVIECNKQGRSATIEDVKVVFENEVGSGPSNAFLVQNSDVTLRDIRVESHIPNANAIKVRSVSSDRDIGDVTTGQIEDVVVDGAVIDTTGAAFYLDGRESPIRRLDTSNVRVKNGEDPKIQGDVWWAEEGYAEESADAEEPQGDYPNGTFVDFTDTNDGSGTGMYLMTRANGLVPMDGPNTLGD